ncbi:MAG: DUF4065 domain-containing protein [Syntrophomonadaceae bacterium]|nr:DUF4065 domain-containing protein [Syntrophomonadaceae bacterium]
MDKVYCYLCDQANDVIIKNEEDSHTIKGTPVHCEVENAYCGQCGSRVYIPALNDANLDRMDHAFREQQGIITVPEIETILERYNIGAKPLSKILGWGEITILRYLKGQIPDRAHSATLLSLNDPGVFANIFEQNRDLLTSIACAKVVAALKDLDEKSGQESEELLERSRRLVKAYGQIPNVFNGFTPFNLEKTVQAILYFIKREGPIYVTRMNKLLWFSDMLCYKLNGRQAITGLVYQHNHFGPVPRWYDYLYGSLDEVYITLIEGKYGTRIDALTDFSVEVFSEDELEVLRKVAKKFKGWSAAKISEYSHYETAYSQTDNGESIPFEYARDLSLN